MSEGVTTAGSRAVRIISVAPFFSTEWPSGVFAFGNAAAADLTLAHVRVEVEDRAGRTAEGWGAIFLDHAWAFPGDDLSDEAKDQIMRAIIGMAGNRLIADGDYGHPLDHFLAIEPQLGEIAIGRGGGGTIDVPLLAALVACSPLDAAIHDAYGKLHGVSSYDALGPDFVAWDLGRVLGERFAGRYLPDFLRSQPVDFLPIMHAVGMSDPLTPAEQGTSAYHCLTDWIAIDGVHCFKVELRGKDLAWDIARLVDVYTTASESVGLAGEVRIFADLDEQGSSPEYVRSLLDGVETRSAAAFAALDAIQQPVRRDPGAGAADFRDVSSRVPVVLDEGLTSLAAIDHAVALGWNGIVLETGKTQSLVLLALAKASELGLHVSVQDLTNPGIALLQSVGLAARLPRIMPVENNQRQYFPATSKPEERVFPWIFAVRDGGVPANELTGPGLGYGDLARIDRDIFSAPPV
ncbi:MAG TPA: enolase C-terminal domain-like protein [Thermomicrobiales bacterium]|nr:enolase C-terminal domain-like protein [Thermomicrobiales bacterium]